MTENRNTFAQFQEQKQNQRAGIIANYLASLSGKGISFPHITALAQFVATHVANEEHRACDKATLLRNEKYRSLLSEFLYRKKAGLENFDVSDVSDSRAHAVVTTAKLEATNLRRENERLKIYVASLESDGKTADRNKGSTRPDSLEALRVSMEAAQFNYATVCQALHSMLEYMKNLIAADADAEQLIDLSKMRNNVIVDRRLAAPFFEWLRLNKGIL